jgi:SEC-C motif domain protein
MKAGFGLGWSPAINDRKQTMTVSAMSRAMVPKPDCPCGTQRAFEECCAQYLSGRLVAPNAEALMRSRYTAYAIRDEVFLLATWHASTRPGALNLAADAATKWTGLEVKRFEVRDTDNAVVEFVARYKIGGRAQRLHETSRFVREEGRWFYLNALTSAPVPSPPPSRIP